MTREQVLAVGSPAAWWGLGWSLHWLQRETAERGYGRAAGCCSRNSEGGEAGAEDWAS